MNRLNNMRLGLRLTLGFGIVLLLMAAMVALALARTAAIDDIGARLVGSDFTKAEAVAALDAATRSNVRRTMELFHVKEPADVEQLRQHIETNRKVVIDALSTLDRLVASSEGLDLLTKLKSARARFAASFSQVDSTLAAGNREEALRLLKSETLPAIDVLQIQVSALSELQKRIVDRSGHEMRAAVRSTQRVLIGAGATALVAGILIAWTLTRSITAPIAQAVKVAHTVAAGDLCSRIEVGARDETGQLLQALKAMNHSLVTIVSQVRQGADSIATGSSQIATGNADLSQRTEEQASNLQQTAASMEQLHSTIRLNADAAREVTQLASEASESARSGGSIVQQVVTTMDEITGRSRRITDIIGVIDGIAFQTNILALNAAVEAARAGEQGRGFAVVAKEVRALAQRSAAAAKETKELLAGSAERVEDGARLVAQAGRSMDDIVTQVQRVAALMADISRASVEQATGVGQVNHAVTQLDQVTQQNAALVEESAAAAESLQQQARCMVATVSAFQLPEGVFNT